jgi:hypothetical protein
VGWNNPRVAGWKAGKFLAALQNASASGNLRPDNGELDNGRFTEEKIGTFKDFASQGTFLL